MEEILKKIGIKEENIIENASMKKYTTFKIGGLAEVLVKVKTIEELEEVIKISRKNNIPINIIGNGSNILVTDKGIRGIVVKIDIEKIEIIEKNSKNIVISVGAGTKLAKFAQIALKEEWGGFEELSGIPRKFWWCYYDECWSSRKRNERYCH